MRKMKVNLATESRRMNALTAQSMISSMNEMIANSLDFKDESKSYTLRISIELEEDLKDAAAKD